MTESEPDIVRRAKRGDEPAFKLLFQRYSRPVLSFLYGMMGRRDVAEDMLQETFGRAFTSLPGLREDPKFSTWLFGIARNVAREEHRRLASDHHRIGLDDAPEDQLLDPKGTPEAEAMNQQLHHAIRSGLASMNHERRTALVLRVFAEKSYQEIGEITGWSLAKVKTEIHRARLEMRRKMAPYV